MKIERNSNFKHKYHDGFVYKTAEVTLNHCRINGNIISIISNQLKDKNTHCEIFNSSVKLHIQAGNRYVYPDGMVICGNIQTSKDYSEAITNPMLIIEVLSKSTADYDRGDKFFSISKLNPCKNTF